MALEIRPITLPLAPVLARLHRESFDAESWSVAQIRGSLKLATTQGWIAFAGTTPVGFILCQSAANEFEILTFCVRPSYRRRKIGARLLEAAIAAARNAGSVEIYLEVATDNQAARILYEGLGFKISGARPGYYKRGAGTADALMYQMIES
jgi:ribosomal-protein-alanine N-acetyltransferase